MGPIKDELSKCIEAPSAKINQLRMREALEVASRQLRKAVRDDRFGDDVVYLVGCMNSVAQKCEAALSTPPRNCDVYTTEVEAGEAFIAWYNSMYDLSSDESDEISSCDLKHNVDGILHSYIKWLFAEAK